MRELLVKYTGKLSELNQGAGWFAYGGCGSAVNTSHLNPLERSDCTQGKFRNIPQVQRTKVGQTLGYGLSTQLNNK